MLIVHNLERSGFPSTSILRSTLSIIANKGKTFLFLTNYTIGSMTSSSFYTIYYNCLVGYTGINIGI